MCRKLFPMWNGRIEVCGGAALQKSRFIPVSRAKSRPPISSLKFRLDFPINFPLSPVLKEEKIPYVYTKLFWISPETILISLFTLNKSVFLLWKYCTYYEGLLLGEEVLLTIFWEFPVNAGTAGKLQYNRGTLRNLFTKPLLQVTAPPGYNGDYEKSHLEFELYVECSQNVLEFQDFPTTSGCPKLEFLPGTKFENKGTWQRGCNIFLHKCPPHLLQFSHE